MKQRAAIMIATVTAFLALAILIAADRQVSSETFITEKREALASAQSIASRIPQAEFKTLTSANVEGKPNYLAVTSALKLALASESSARRAYAVRQLDGMFYFAADPTPEGDFNQDGKQDKGSVMQPISDPFSTLLYAAERKVPTADSQPNGDARGSFIRAVAPIVSPRGNVLGFIVTEHTLPPTTTLSRSSAFWFMAAGLLVFSFAIGLSLAHYILPKGQQYQFRLASARAQAFAIAAALFAALGVAGFAYAAFGAIRLNRTVDNSTNLTILLDALQHAQVTVLDIEERKPTVSDFAVNKLTELGRLELASQLRALIQESEIENAKPRQLAAVEALFSKQISRTTHELRDNNLRMNAELNSVFVGLVSAILLGIAATLFIRRTIGDLENRGRGEFRADTEYKSILSSLPIGLLLWTENRVAYKNDERILQLLFNEANSLTPDLTKARDEITASLELAERGRQVVKRILEISHSGSSVVYELQCQPVFTKDDSLEYVLGFVTNITETARFSERIRRKNSEIEHKNSLLEDALSQLERNFESIVRALVRAVEAKDPYTAGHSERVMQYSLWIGEHLGLGSYELRLLEMGCLVHDIGKIGIPDSVLTKPGKLNDEEFELIKKHPEYGANIVRNVDLFRECLPIILWHHERLNGTGYPDGLKGEEIPFLVRICSVADVFDAMTSTRSYRVGMPIEKVFSIIDGDVEKGHLDATVVQALKEVITVKGIITQNDVADFRNQAA